MKTCQTMLNKNINRTHGYSNLISLFVLWLGCISATLYHSAQAQIVETGLVTIEASTSLEWNQAQGIYTALGDALVEQGNKKLRSDKIVAKYDPKSENRDLTHIIATGSVKYTDGNNIAHGFKMDYEINGQGYKLMGPQASVTGSQGTMKAEKYITYKTNAASMDQMIGEGKAFYKGQDGRIVEAERIEALLSTGGEIETINADGNAKVVTPQGIVATADRLQYTAKYDRADLFGNVEIINKENIMRGARAEVNFKGEVSKLLSDNSGKRVSGVLTP